MHEEWLLRLCLISPIMINTLQFADDQVVMAQSKEDLEYMGRKLQEEYSKWGFTMNIAKTKYMPVGTDTNHLEMDNHYWLYRI